MLALVKERNDAMIKAVTKDNWKPIKAYCKKYGVDMKDEEAVFKGGVYLATQSVKGIPNEVKEKARLKYEQLHMGNG